MRRFLAAVLGVGLCLSSPLGILAEEGPFLLGGQPVWEVKEPQVEPLVIEEQDLSQAKETPEEEETEEEKVFTASYVEEDEEEDDEEWPGDPDSFEKSADFFAPDDLVGGSEDGLETILPDENGDIFYEDPAPSLEDALVGDVEVSYSYQVSYTNWHFLSGSYLLEKPAQFQEGGSDAGELLVSTGEDLVFWDGDEVAEEPVALGQENTSPLGDISDFSDGFVGLEGWEDSQAEVSEDDLVMAVEAEGIDELGFSDVAVEALPEEVILPEAQETPFEEIALVGEAEEEAGFADEMVGLDTGRWFSDQDGLVKITTTRADGSTHTGIYTFGEEGAMVLGNVELKNGTYYMRQASEAKLDEGYASGTEKNPYNSTLGQVAVNSWRWVSKAKVFKRYGADGKFVPIETLRAEYLKDPVFPGYFSIGGSQFALTKKGEPRTGTVKLTNGKGETYTYFFSPVEQKNGLTGQMFHDGWYADITSKGTRWRYFSPQAATLGRLWAHGIIAAKLDDNTYLLSKKGYLIKDAVKMTEDGNYFCSDENGVVRTDVVVKSGAKEYYYGANGARVKWKNGFFRCPGDKNRYNYFGSEEGCIQPVYGWKLIKDGESSKIAGWFYFYENGKHKLNAWMSNHTRYATADGSLAQGLTKIGSDYYYFTPSTTTAYNGKRVNLRMLKIGNDYSYTGADGKLVKSGWITYNGYHYKLKDYKCIVNKTATYEKVKGWLDDAGRFLTAGWNIIDDAKNKIKYVNPKNGKLVVATSKKIGAYTYYFDEHGYRRSDLTDIVTSGYLLDCDRVNGVITVYNAAKTMPVKNIRCSVGLPGTETPLGTYKLNTAGGGRWQLLIGPSYGQYATQVTGDILIHSVPTATQTITGVPKEEYDKLGTPASHGCIRVCVADAKWVYEHCNGATIRIFDGRYQEKECYKGYLGRDPLVPMTGNVDPTDPLGNQ